ncbi:MAG: helix-turn-helix domain-containing protein [Calditrichia bacterium]
METSLTIWHTLVLIGAIQGFVLTTFLFLHKTGNSFANRILAALIFAVSLDILLSFLYLSGYIFQVPHLISLAEPLYLLYGPLLFLYTKTLTSRDYTFSPLLLLTFLPFALELILWLPFYIQSAESKINAYQQLNLSDEAAIEYLFIWLLEMIYNLALVVLSVRVVQKHGQKIKDEFSDISQINLNWLKGLLTATLFLFAAQLFILFFIVADASDADIEASFVFHYVFIAVLFYGVGYMGLRQSSVFREDDQQINLTSDPEKKEMSKYAKSSLSNDSAEQLSEELQVLMEGKKLYLENGLKLQDLAQRLSISTNHLSQILNSKLNMSFFDFVNGYRVKEAQRLLISTEHQHLTLLAIAFEAGFSSKSAFNKVFKETTGLTPSQFRRQNV